MNLIEFKHVHKTFHKIGTNVTALKDINFKVNQGDIFGVIGYSGAGKSTLVRLVNQLETQSTGDIWVDGHHLNTYNQKALRKVKKDIGMIFQHFNLLNSKTVYKNIAMPLILAKVPPKKIKQRVEEMIAFVGLKGKTDHFPNQLSGGQKQRVAIARALVTNPKILLCDEATSALDPATTDAILDLLKKTNETFNVTILIITHEMSVIKKICDRVAVMDNGRIIELDTVKHVFSHPQTQTAQRFVSTVINTTPSELLLEEVKTTPHSQLFKLFIENHQIQHAIINDLIQKIGVRVNIVHAFMTDIQADTVGYLWLNIEGDASHLTQTRDYLSAHHIQFEEV